MYTRKHSYIVKVLRDNDFWNELDVEADSNTYASLERVNLRTGYNKEHLTNIVSYQKFARIAAVIIPLFLFNILYCSPL